MKGKAIVILGVVAIAAWGVVEYYQQSAHSEPPLTSKAKSDQETQAVIQYPVAPSHQKDQASETPVPLGAHLPPATAESEEKTIEELVSQLVGHDRFESLFITTDIVKRFVITVDNATGRRFPSEISVFGPLVGGFRVDTSPDGPILSSENYSRYSDYVELLNSINLHKLVNLYARHYSLFQAAYRELGMKGYFNDRLVAVIDNALATPEVSGPVKLVLSGYFKFADPQLESLSVIQKILIRMGPTNADVVKRDLRHIRKLLTHLGKRSGVHDVQVIFSGRKYTRVVGVRDSGIPL
jgi:hypothetical protein